MSLKKGKCIILLNGAKPPFNIEEEDILICADSGMRCLSDQDRFPNYLVGDMDSVSDEEVLSAIQNGTIVKKYPTDKDLSDGQIALELALSIERSEIMIYGGKTGRIDHILSSIQMLGSIPASTGSRLFLDRDEVLLIRNGEELTLRTDKKIISILPGWNDCIISIRGLKWELTGEKIEMGSTRFIHNENLSRPFTISSIKGNIYLILTDEE